MLLDSNIGLRNFTDIVKAEMSVGPFFKIQFNPIHQITDPIQSNPLFILSAKTPSDVSEFDSCLQLMLHVDS